MGHLCEFIEDCEHTVLATRILHLLGREGPRSQNPSKYIRFIYNRVILENAAVRAGNSQLNFYMLGGPKICESLLMIQLQFGQGLDFTFPWTVYAGNHSHSRLAERLLIAKSRACYFIFHHFVEQHQCLHRYSYQNTNNNDNNNINHNYYYSLLLWWLWLWLLLLLLLLLLFMRSLALFFSAAVTSLAKFGAHCDSLCSSILVLLSRFVIFLIFKVECVFLQKLNTRLRKDKACFNCILQWYTKVNLHFQCNLMICFI